MVVWNELEGVGDDELIIVVEERTTPQQPAAATPGGGEEEEGCGWTRPEASSACGRS